MKQFFGFFLFQKRPGDELPRKKRVIFWLWNAILLAGAAIVLGIISLALAPYKCAVLPLSKKLGGKAMEIQAELSKWFMVDYDDTGSIGKRYRRQDEIGTPYCVTVDFQTVGSETEEADHAVTIRDRDTMEQVRVPISELKNWLDGKLVY